MPELVCRSGILTLLFLGLAVLCPGTHADLDAQGTRMLRQPTVSQTHIAFVHANDIWLTGRDGGNARRLTSAEGAETDPAFSPDGDWIAFTGQYAGNTDVYVMPAMGGEPERLTWHPGADVVQGWTGDGKILFQSGREGHPTRLWQFFTVHPNGGFPEAVSEAQAYDGEMSRNGEWMAYQEIGYWDPEWRNYRGGQAQPIRVVSTGDWSLRSPTWEGERQMAPVWMDGVVYYMSERDWASNVWSFDPASGEERQHTFHTDFDVKSLGAGHGVVVYEQGGYLHELDPGSGSSRQLEVLVAGDMTWARPRWEDVPAAGLRDARLSPTGKRAIFEYRGELFTVPLEDGSWRNITGSPGVADRHAVWSPKGDKVAWFSDEGGEYGLMVADQDGANPRRIGIPDPTFFFVPTWSPDGTRLAFTDTDYRVLILEVESGDLTHVDTDRFAHPERSMNPVWSPDSRWICYSRRLDNQLRAVFVHDTRSGETHQLTDGMADAISPVWDESGKYLYFLGSNDYGLNTGWLDMTSFDHPVTRALFVALLQEGEPSPFLPKSDEESSASGEEEEGEDAPGQSGGSGEDEAGGGAPPVVIDFEGISRRILDAPGLPLRNYAGLVEGPEGKIFVAETVPNARGLTLHRYTLDDAEAEEFLTGVLSATASFDRKKLLIRAGAGWKVADTGGGPPQNGGEGLSTDGIRIQVDPKAEYAQMLRDGWRFMRDFLYVDNAHGAPWDEVWDWYSPWLEHVNHRSDFNQLLDMLSGEIAVGHSYVRGGDYPDLESPRTGLLGANLREVDGFYRIDKILSMEESTVGMESPLAIPGLGVEDGDFILAIDGRALRPPTNPFMLLEGTAGRTIVLTVNDEPTFTGARDVVIRPVGNEGQLRTMAWVVKNQKKVDELSGGRLAYVWLPNTGTGGYAYFNRMYFAQQHKEGAVIDERNNGGGSAADYIIDVMARELTGYFNSRAGDRKPFTQPMAGLWGPKVMIINERAGSGGDLMPYLFRFREVGPLVGTRTWGGLVGTWDTPPLIDGGRFVAPRGGFFDVDGEWAVEAEGVAPDIEVSFDPVAHVRGEDPQLEAAVQEALRLLQTEGVELKPEPAAPIRWRRPNRRGGGGI